jgi:biopolymer transport protein TolR
MGMGGGGGSRHSVQSDINVTPLVDVCLVLLIIFMVVTPLLQKGIPIQLPTTDNPGKKPENEKQKLITIEWATPPKYYIGSKWFPKDEFQKELDELFQRSPATELVIKADQRLKYGEVKEVMKMTKEAGFQDVGLITDKKTVAGTKKAAA